jgi:hypothetical protein
VQTPPSLAHAEGNLAAAPARPRRPAAASSSSPSHPRCGLLALAHTAAPPPPLPPHRALRRQERERLMLYRILHDKERKRRRVDLAAAASARLFMGNLASPCRSPCSVTPPSLPLLQASWHGRPPAPAMRLHHGCPLAAAASSQRPRRAPGCGAVTLIFLLPFWMWNSIAQQFFSAPILREK